MIARLKDVGKYRRIIVLALLVSLTLGGCAALEAQRRQKEELKAADVVADRLRILVLTGDIAYPHEVLGRLEYTEMFSPEAIETSHINDRIRRMAVARYGSEVDAITHLQSSLNDSATLVTVSADAVRVKIACSFCRHQLKNSKAELVRQP